MAVAVMAEVVTAASVVAATVVKQAVLVHLGSFIVVLQKMVLLGSAPRRHFCLRSTALGGSKPAGAVLLASGMAVVAALEVLAPVAVAAVLMVAVGAVGTAVVLLVPPGLAVLAAASLRAFWLVLLATAVQAVAGGRRSTCVGLPGYWASPSNTRSSPCPTT